MLYLNMQDKGSGLQKDVNKLIPRHSLSHDRYCFLLSNSLSIFIYLEIFRPQNQF